MQNKQEAYSLVTGTQKAHLFKESRLIFIQTLSDVAQIIKIEETGNYEETGDEYPGYRRNELIELIKYQKNQLAEHIRLLTKVSLKGEKNEQEINELKKELAKKEEELAEAIAEGHIDVLTKIDNRKSYNERIAQEIERWKRYGGKFCLLVIDIDKFKTFNDTYGHSTGDEVLVRVAQLLKNKLRKSDYVARYGGEEFVIILPEQDIIGAELTASKLVQSVKKGTEDLSYGPITISAGISQINQRVPLINEKDKRIINADDLFNAADAALYYAKKTGRNKAICFEQEMSIKEKKQKTTKNLTPEQEKDLLEKKLGTLIGRLDELKEDFECRTDMLKNAKNENQIKLAKRDIAKLENEISIINEEVKSLNKKIEQIEKEYHLPKAETAVA